jgi:hypothetical protein
VYLVGVDFWQKYNEFAFAERFLREALAKSKIWLANEDDRRRCMLGIAECELLAGNYQSAETDYEAIVADAVPRADRTFVRHACLGYAAALALGGKFKSAEQVLAARFADLAEAAPTVTHVQRKNLQAIFQLLVSAYYEAGSIEEATRWQREFDQWKAALPVLAERSESHTTDITGSPQPES